jgi:hypothetical protein
MSKPTNSILLGFLIFSSYSIAAESPDAPTPVASYANRPELRETVGTRVGMLLREHKIESMSYGSAGLTISVPANRAVEARQLLAKAIKAEKLQLTLIVLKGDRYVVVTPDSILEPKKPQ